jgi:hypothetical protein
LENIVFTRRQQPYPRDDAQARLASARLAAEALFAAKPAVDEPPPLPGSEAVEPAVRKPRVLSIVPPPPIRPPPAADPPRPALNGRKPRLRRVIPRAQHSRIRTWVTYGMTAAEVARLYGAAVGEVERIVGKAGSGGAGEGG